MRFTLLVVAGGLAIGLLRGGRPGFLAGRALRAWPLLGAGVALQALAGAAGADRGGGALLLASYVVLVAFALANLAVVGMWLVATGIALNLAAIAANGAMPVRPSALVAAGIAAPERAEDVRLGARHRLERPSDRLRVLGDIVPVAPLREVLSFGDLVMAVGAADVAAHLVAPPRRRRPPSGDEGEPAGAARAAR